MKYEYNMIHIKKREYKKLSVDTLNSFGSDGWVLTCIEHIDDNVVLIFYKQKKY